MAPSRRLSNGRSPLVNQQSQITSFFSKTSSSSPSPVISEENHKNNPKPCPTPSPTTPSPIQTKHKKKPILVIGPSPTLPLTPASDSKSTPNSVKKCYGQEVVNKRIRVYWPLDQSWYEGCVKSFDKISGKHSVQYDDADEELLDLANEKIEWLDETARRFRRLRRVSLIEDEEDANLKGLESEGNDSTDEDWGKNAEKEAIEDVSEDMDLDDEDDEDEGVESAKPPRGNSDSRKRKISGEKLGFSKKNKSNADVKKRVRKIPLDVNGGKLTASTNNKDSK